MLKAPHNTTTDQAIDINDILKEDESNNFFLRWEGMSFEGPSNELALMKWRS